MNLSLSRVSFPRPSRTGSSPRSRRLVVRSSKNGESLHVCVLGASGDLSRRKIFPALYSLFEQNHLPESFAVFGYARSALTRQEFQEEIRKGISENRPSVQGSLPALEEFLEHCYYRRGEYDSKKDFHILDQAMTSHVKGRTCNRIFYLSVPPSVFIPASKMVKHNSSPKPGFTRLIVEKPFGKDLTSSNSLSKALVSVLPEQDIFRMDHYLGKELVENLLVLRFSNLIFEPLWSRKYIRNVQLVFSESQGTYGRGGYFDQYGIVRDIVQNHLMQVVSLIAMEPPVSLHANDIRDEKVKVLRQVEPIEMGDVVLGQYKGRDGVPGYTDDATVEDTSNTPTFAAMALKINNARWDGVPFLLKAGKALHQSMAEIRIQFRHVPGNLYKSSMGANIDNATNELVIRIQPEEAIYMVMNNKVPGLGVKLDKTTLNLQYKNSYQKVLPDAYERLLLDVIQGDKRLFVRDDELRAAWEIFTPLLKDIEHNNRQPEYYNYGSRGPIGSHYLAAKHHVKWGDV